MMKISVTLRPVLLASTAVVTVLLLLPLISHAQIYRCDTEEGPVFSDQPCDGDAAVVTLAEQSQGLVGGPSEEVREYLDQKRQERAEQREKAAQFSPSRTRPVIIQQVQPQENVALLPGYLRPVRPGHPIERPRPRPLPEGPEPPGNAGGGGTPSVIRPISLKRD